MGRISLVLLVLFSGTALACGCASARLQNPFASSDNSSAKALAKKKEAQKKAVADSKSKEKEKDKDEADDDSETKVASKSNKSGKNKEQKTAASKPKGADGNAQTIALIEHETPDATPEERQALLEQLKGQDPSMIRQILRARNMTLQMQKQQAQAANGEEGNSFTRPIPEGADGNLVASAQNRRSGLGASNPWGGAKDVTSDLNGGNPGNGSPATITPRGNVGAPNGIMQVAHTEVDPGNPNARFEPPKSAHLSFNDGQITGQTSAGRAPGAAPVTQLGGTQLQNGNPAQNPIPQAQYLGSLTPGAYNAPPPAEANLAPSGIQNVNYTPGAGNPLLVNGQQTAWPEQLQRLVSIAEAEAGRTKPGSSEVDKQTYIEKHVYLRMLYLMAGQQERALQAIPGLDPADQEFWQQTFWGIGNYFDANAIPISADRATQTVTQLTHAVMRLQEKANLEMRNVTFCHKISSFGNYERFPRDEFSPGQPVLLYAEIDNFHSDATASGQYRTILRSTLEVHKPGPQGELIERIEFPATEDICRNHRRDYFHSYEFTIPQKLSLGPYVVKLVVEDQLSRRVASYSLNFTVK